MRRRDFITLISGAASLWPLTAHAQTDGKQPTIGFLGASSESAWAAQVSSFNQRLRELGWADGRTVLIVYRWAEGKLDRYSDFAAEFVQKRHSSCEAGDIDDPNCIRRGLGSIGKWFREQLGSSRGQYHRIV